MRRLCLLLAGLLLVIDVYAQPAPGAAARALVVEPLVVALGAVSALLSLLLGALLWVWTRHTRQVDRLAEQQRQHGEEMTRIRERAVTHPELTGAVNSLRAEVTGQVGTLRKEMDTHVGDLRREVRDGNTATHRRLDQLLAQRGKGE